MTSELNLTEAIELNRKTSIYGNGEMYLALSEKEINYICRKNTNESN